MRTNTKIKNLLTENTLTLSLNSSGEIEIIITNNHTGNAHLCKGPNISQATERAYRDTMKISGTKDMEF